MEKKENPENLSKGRPCVAIAGISGFVGDALATALKTRYPLVGISRSQLAEHHKGAVTWRQADLFSLKDAEKALKGVDVAYYLIHSMMPSARLNQGHFSDYDLIAADNFIRAAASNGVKHIIYLSGIIPEQNQQTLSDHLRSRWEVETILSSRSIPLTTLRSGLILGGLGSSFLVLQKLVQKSPVLLCPPQLQTKTQPISLPDVLAYLCRALEQVPDTPQRTVDIGGAEVVTYQELIKLMATALGKKRLVFKGPPVPLRLASSAISVLTGAPVKLVSPLLESLRYEMLVRNDSRLILSNHVCLPLNQALKRSIAEYREHTAQGHVPITYQRKGARFKLRGVRSIQRLPLPQNRDAQWVATEYLRWLPRFFRVILRVRVKGPRAIFFLVWLPRPLLVLELSPSRSQADRQLFYIKGGLLAKKVGRGRLEFRELLDNETILAGIHDFVPRLPWYIYIYTQAIVHLIVMKAFSRHLRQVSGNTK